MHEQARKKNLSLSEYVRLLVLQNHSNHREVKHEHQSN
jgi:hypothetical protein